MSFPSGQQQDFCWSTLARFEFLGRLFDSGVHLLHRQGNLIGGVVLTTGGQTTERVGLIEQGSLRLWPPSFGLLDDRLKPFRLVGQSFLVAFDELGQHVLAHELDRLHRRLMGARSEQQDQLVDAALFVAAQKLAHGGGAADRPSARAVHDRRILFDLLEMALPHTGTSRRVHSGHVVMHDAEREKSTAHSEPLDGLLIGGGHHH